MFPSALPSLHEESPVTKLTFFKGSAYDPDPLDPQDFGLLDPDPQNINQKLQNKIDSQISKSEKREI